MPSERAAQHRALGPVASPHGSQVPLWPELVRKVLELGALPQHWRPTEIAAIPAPVLLVAADNDVVRLQHTVELYHLLGGGINGDVRGLPAARLAVVPGTTHTGLCDRAARVAPMTTEFLGD